MIADKWFEKKTGNTISKVVNKYGTTLTTKEKDKITNTSTKIYVTITTIALTIFIIYLFTNLIPTKIGTDKTTILLLTIIMIILKSKN